MADLKPKVPLDPDPPLAWLFEGSQGQAFRLRWWQRLEQEEPEVAKKLCQLFPHKYPVKEAKP